MSYFNRLAAVLTVALSVSASLFAADVVVNNSAALRVAINQAQPGTRILMAPGTYGDGLYVDMTPGGTPDQPIIIAAQDPLNPPVFNTPSGIMFNNVSNFVLDNLVINSSASNSIQIAFGQNVVLKNIKSGQCNTGGAGTPIKFTGCTNFLLTGSSATQYGGLGVNMVGSAKGLLINNNFSNPNYPNAFCAFEAKGGSYGIGIYNNVLTQSGARVLQMGGDTGPSYFHQGNIGLGWECYDSVAMGNKIIGGGYPINFSTATNVRFEYNTVVNPTTGLLRILNEGLGSDTIGNPTANCFYSHNLVQYGNVAQLANVGPSVNANSFTYDGNYWYKTTSPASSFPSLPGTVTNNAGKIDPQFDANYDPQYAPAKAYGAGAAAKEAAFLQYVNGFQWAWDTMQTYLPNANGGGIYAIAPGRSIVLNGSSSTGGKGSYGNYSVSGWQWDLNADSTTDRSGANSTLSYSELAASYGLGSGDKSINLTVSALDEFGKTLTDAGLAIIRPGYKPGDANGDNLVNGQDIRPFLLGLANNLADYRLACPQMDMLSHTDINGDLAINGQDIYPFINALAAPASAAPEPLSLSLLGLSSLALLRRRRISACR